MQVQAMDGVDQLGLSFACLDLKFCADVGGIHPDDEVTDENKVRRRNAVFTVLFSDHVVFLVFKNNSLLHFFPQRFFLRV